MPCKRCNSERIVVISAKASDLFTYIEQDTNYEINGYLPNCAVGGGDYANFRYCNECGQLQGNFPHKGVEIVRYDVSAIMRVVDTIYSDEENISERRHLVRGKRVEILKVLDKNQYEVKEFPERYPAAGFVTFIANHNDLED